MTIYIYGVRRRRQECDSSPPQWGVGELRDSQSRKYFYFICNLLPSKGCANRRQAESNHACMNCRDAKEENKRSAVKSRRGETIAGSVFRRGAGRHARRKTQHNIAPSPIDYTYKQKRKGANPLRVRSLKRRLPTLPPKRQYHRR